MRRFVYTLLCCLFVLQARADVDLIVWQQSSGAPAVILPKKRNESFYSAVNRYFRNLNRIQKTADFSRIDLADHGTISEFNPKSKNRIITAVNANMVDDMYLSGSRIQRNIKLLNNNGAETYIIALGAELGLNVSEVKSFHDKIAESFDLMISLGGRDIDPSLYLEKNRKAVSVNYVTDKLELDRVKSFKNKDKGLFFGICRGHQLGAVADGHTLYQDLSEDTHSNTDRHVNLDGKNATEQQTWHKVYVMNSMLYRFLKNQSYVEVNSIHHQAVRMSQKGQSFAVALAEGDMLVEGLQSYNQKSLSVQFHAEFPEEISQNKEFSEKGRSILRGVIAYARLLRQNRKIVTSQCASIFL